MNPPTDEKDEKKEEDLKRLDSSPISNDSTTPIATAPNKRSLKR